MASNPAIQLAETIQTASINRAPSPSHDLNPSTSASVKIPVKTSDPSLSQYLYASDSERGDDGVEIDPADIQGLDDEEEEEEDEEDVERILRPVGRRKSFGPLPDLRFEQSYLASIRGAETTSRVVYITVRDQVLLPLLQGTIWSLALFGWRHWNRNAQLSGSSVGARIRRWWYRTNNWRIPELKRGLRDKIADSKLAGEVGDFYQNKSSSD